jgi:hypothetical protein
LHAILLRNAQTGQRNGEVPLNFRSAFDVTLVVALFMGSLLVIAVIGPAHARQTSAFCADSTIAGEQKQLEKLVEVAGDVKCKQQQPTAQCKSGI